MYFASQMIEIGQGRARPHDGYCFKTTLSISLQRSMITNAVLLLASLLTSYSVVGSEQPSMRAVVDKMAVTPPESMATLSEIVKNGPGSGISVMS